MKPVMAKENEKVVGTDRVMARVKDLLRANQDVVPRLDEELGQTSTVKMRIDRGDHPQLS